MKKSALYIALASLSLGAALPATALANDPDEQETAGATATWNGTVEAVNRESLTLKESNGSSVKVEMGKQTKYDNAGKQAKVSDLRPGMTVAVEGEKNKDGTVSATEIRFVDARKAEHSK
jgi:hypothetical protein